MTKIITCPHCQQKFSLYSSDKVAKPRRPYKKLSREEFMACVHRHTSEEISVDEIIGPDKTNLAVAARWAVWKELYEAGFHQAEIAYYSKVDRTSIYQAIQLNFETAWSKKQRLQGW